MTWMLDFVVTVLSDAAPSNRPVGAGPSSSPRRWLGKRPAHRGSMGAMELIVDHRFGGPPAMGHGGYVAGLFAVGVGDAIQVTLRRPTPLDTPLELLHRDDGRGELRHGDELIAEAEPASLDLEVPVPPSAADAAAAEPGSPSHRNGRGVHPTCFGCGIGRDPGDALRIAAGPIEVDGVEQVAAAWLPGPTFAGAGGDVTPQFVVAALDCPGAFAFITDAMPAGLLGRIVFQQHHPVPADATHVVTGWQIGTEGRKLLAGTALFAPDGTLLAAARATWFAFPG